MIGERKSRKEVKILGKDVKIDLLSNPHWRDMMKDVFISHAFEDKKAYVHDLAKELDSLGVSVWYDSYELKPGDSMLSRINDGLQESHYGVVVLSEAFFNPEKKWTHRELAAIMAKTVGDRNAIIPVWHNIGFEMIKENYPILLDYFALMSSDGYVKNAYDIAKVVRPDLLTERGITNIGTLAEAATIDVHQNLIRYHPSGISDRADIFISESGHTYMPLMRLLEISRMNLDNVVMNVPAATVVIFEGDRTTAMTLNSKEYMINGIMITSETAPVISIDSVLYGHIASFTHVLMNLIIVVDGSNMTLFNSGSLRI